MKLAPISAPQWAEKVQRGDYHMVIAPWLFEIPGYAQYYNQAARPKGTHVILDNGSWEGYRTTPETLARGAAVARANEVVLPDVLAEGGQTLRVAYQAIKVLQDDPDITGLMFVPQGKDLAEWRKCMEAWQGKWEQEGYGARFDLTWGLMSTRREKNYRPEAILLALATGYPIHLLGLSDVQVFVTRELRLADHGRGQLRGIDTSLPFALACGRQLLTPDSHKVPLRKPHEYANLGQWTLTRTYLNVLILRDWCEKCVATREIPIELVRRAAGNTRKVYSNPQTALRLCRVPQGRYAVRYEGSIAKAVLPLRPGERTEHTIMEVYYG